MAAGTPVAADALPAGSSPFGDGDGGLRDALAVPLRHKWAVIAVFLLVMTISAVRVFNQVPVYGCSPATIEVVSDNRGVSSVEDALNPQWLTDQQYNTHMNLLHSHEVLQAAWEEHPRLKTAMSFGEFAGGVVVRPVRNSFLINVSFEGPDPEINPVAANAVVLSYRDRARRERENRTSTVSDEYQKRVEMLREDYATVLEELATFRRDNGVVDVQADKEHADRLLANLDTELDDETKRQVRLEASVAVIQTARQEGRLEHLDPVRSDPLYVNLVRRIDDLEQKLAEHRIEFTPGPRDDLGRQMEEQIQSLRQERNDLVDAIVGRVETDYTASLRVTDSIRETRDKRKGERERLSALLVTQSNLETRRENMRDELDRLEKLTSDVVRVGNLDLSPIRLWETARVSRGVIRPNPVRDLMTAALLAAALAIGFAFLLEQIRSTISEPTEFAHYSGLPVLGVIPRVTSAKGASELITHEVPNSEFAEAVRIIRTALLFSPSGAQRRSVFLVTSPEAGEGKTIVSVNLSIAMAQAGHRTLLIDCDLRNPRVHKVFGVDNVRGLSNIFAQPETRADDLEMEPLEGLSNFRVIPCGPIPPNPSELLAGDRLERFLEEALTRFDRVIIDSPPAGPVSDPAMLSRNVDGVMLVVNSGRTRIRDLKRARGHLDKVNAPLLGLVVNNMQSTGRGYYYYRYGK